jgi:hypothetical protein
MNTNDNTDTTTVYWTVVIPPTSWERDTKWHGHNRTLTRGAFDTTDKAHEWAAAHLGGNEYSLQRIEY